MHDPFFEKQTQSSRIKAGIVANYFPSYATILQKGNPEKIIYLDLFSGPGIYEDGNYSTPILIAKACAEKGRLNELVHLGFNDPFQIENLKRHYFKIFDNRDPFKFKTKFGNRVVGEDPKIYEFLMRAPKEYNTKPTLLFFDPYGYKGTDSRALANFLENYGNEI